MIHLPVFCDIGESIQKGSSNKHHLTNSVNKVKVLITVPTLECGGLERNVSIICNHINTSKYDVTLVVLNNANQFFRITNPEVNVIDLKINNVRMSLFAILKLSRRIKPAIILSTANHLNLFLAIFKGLFPRNQKLVARESSIVSVNTQRTWNPRLYHWMLRRFYRNTDLIVCQSEYMRYDLFTHYHIPEEKMRIIFNSVTPPPITDKEEGDEPYAKLITVARLSSEKGLDRLIRAVSLLKIPYQFTIIGEGNMRSALQELIKKLSLEKSVFLTGSCDEPFKKISKPHLFLMGSYYEGFPNAMLEAIAAGIPCVAFNAPGGISELLVNNENGILVNGDDENVFAEAIQKALSYPFDKKKIRESALQRFNVNNVMEQWYRVFESLI